MKKENNKKNFSKEIKEMVVDLLEKLDIGASVVLDVILDEEDKDIDHYEVKIETQETGLLIGRRGEILNSLQLLLGVMIYKKLGKWIRIVLDVGDYRKSRENSVKEMAERIVQEVEASGQAVALPYLSPLERRYVHIMLKDHKLVSTESIGDGKERRLVIKPKEK